MNALAAALLCCVASQDRFPAELRDVLKDAENVVPFKTCEPLIALLRAGKVKEFNTERDAFKNKYLDFGDYLKNGYGRSDAFQDLELGGADLSRILFGRTRFNGCALDRCDFSKSYLQDVVFYDPPSLSEAGNPRSLYGVPATFGVRPTTLARAVFRGVLLRQDKDRLWWGGFDFVDASKIVADGLVQEWVGSDGFQRRHDRRVRELIAGASALELSEVGRRGQPIDLKTYGVEIENPFARLGADAEKEWKEAGIDPAALKGLKALRINADANFDWTNADAKTLFVLGEGFFTMGNIYSRGPVLFTGRAHVMGDVFSDSWVGCFEEGLPRNLIHAAKILIGPGGGGQARSLMSPALRGEFGFGKGGESWLRERMRTQSMKTLAAKLHPGGRRVLSAQAMGREVTAKELLGDAPPPFPKRPELEGRPILLLDEKQMSSADSFSVLVHDDPSRIVAVPCIFRNRIQTLYSDGPVLMLDKDSTWSPPVIVSRGPVQSQKGKEAPRGSIVVDVPDPAGPFEPEQGVRKSLPAPLAGSAAASPDVQILQGNGLSLVVIVSEGRATHTILSAGPLGMSLGPGFRFTMGEKHAVTETTPEGFYVGFPDSGFRRVDAEMDATLVKRFRKLEVEKKDASLAAFLRTQPLAKTPLVRKLLDSAK
ncbi:MAG TPA: hypothetical protein VNM14_09755 [Planctomycetota bacterium]|nr:hypothetical protein [Planctomycetota bacterium]